MSILQQPPEDILYDQELKQLSVIYGDGQTIHFQGIRYTDEAPVVTKESLNTVMEEEIFTVYGVVDVSFRNESKPPKRNGTCDEMCILEKCPWLKTGKCTSINRLGAFGKNQHEESMFLA